MAEWERAEEALGSVGLSMVKSKAMPGKIQTQMLITQVGRSALFTRKSSAAPQLRYLHAKLPFRKAADFLNEAPPLLTANAATVGNRTRRVGGVCYGNRPKLRR